MEKLMTINEVAEFLNVKASTFHKWMEKGIIQCPYYRLNNKKTYRFRKSDVDKLLIKEISKTEEKENEQIKSC